jgi:serine/threonine protein kinase
MPRLSALSLYRRIQSSLTMRAVKSPAVKCGEANRNGRRFLFIESANKYLMTALRWIHNKNNLFPFGHPFLRLAKGANQVSEQRIEMELPKGFGAYEKLTDHIAKHPNPTDRDHNSGKSALHLDDVVSICGQVADGLTVAAEVNVLLRITPQGIVAKKSRTKGSEFREWKVRINEFKNATTTNATAIGPEKYSNCAPEEVRNGKSTEASERYRLGLVLYTLLTRKNPLHSVKNIREILAEEREMYIELRESELRRSLTEVELKEIDKNNKLPKNWESMTEMDKVLFMGKRLFNNIKSGNDLLLYARLWNEPLFAQKEIVSLLQGLLNVEGAQRISLKEAFQRLRKLEERYVIHIDTQLSSGDRAVHFGNKYKDKGQVTMLGYGGMAAVYNTKFHKLGMGYRVGRGAAKIALMEEFGEFFTQELENVRALQGIKNVVSVNGGRVLGETKGFHDETGREIVREQSMVKGTAIHFEKVYDTLNSDGRIKPITSAEQLFNVLGVMIRVGETLKKIHDRGIVHRDIKFENIGMKDASWNPDGVRILDFGISVDTRSEAQMNKEREAAGFGRLKGTPFYMSPETTTGANTVTPKSDVFALATCLYELLYGAKGANLKEASFLETMAGITTGKRLSRVLEGLRKGAMFAQNKDLVNGEVSKKTGRLNDPAVKLAEENLHSINTLDLSRGGAGYEVRGQALVKSSDVTAEQIELNEAGLKVQEKLISVFKKVLATKYEDRNSMAQFVSELYSLRAYLDAEFTIRAKRSVPNMGRVV